LKKEQEIVQMIQAIKAQAEWLKRIPEEVRNNSKRNNKVDFYKNLQTKYKTHLRTETHLILLNSHFMFNKY
jgi:hypothetical protein